jgi:hypothetical protein
MRMPRFQFTVRRVMIGIAVVACSLGGFVWSVRMKRLSAIYHQRAADYLDSAEMYRQLAEGEGVGEVGWINENEIPGETSAGRTNRMIKLRSHYAQLGRKYLQAAARPWAPVGADPAAPTFPVVGADEYGIWCRHCPEASLRLVEISWNNLVGVEGVKREQSDRYDNKALRNGIVLKYNYNESIIIYDDFCGFDLIVEQITMRLHGIDPEWYQRVQKTAGELPLTVWSKPQPTEESPPEIESNESVLRIERLGHGR